ncbi:kinetochore Sim4 complex subunit FTA2-domain-containing protein [Nemania sp. FL0031]|nr:kinetochore Sim4 complex subunit FTA2-domain-containing protein [Nemania sp. FL0031]
MAGLPNVPGPKLHPFDTTSQRLKIDFLEQIGKGLHSFVWKVKIHGEIYALKIFNAYYDPPKLYGVDASEEDKESYFQPFQNECRAYGRLKESGREDLAVACYGYVTLEETHVRILRKAYTDIEWEYDWGCDPDVKYDPDLPLQALVKELIHIPTDLKWRDEFALSMNPRIARKAIKDLKTLHRLGICVGDISSRNFIFGKHLEFSFAWTAPHPLLTRKYGSNFPPLQRHLKDTSAIDDLIDDWNRMHPNRKIWVCCEPSLEYRNKLRKRNRKEVYWDLNPADFDYEMAENRFGKLRTVVVSYDNKLSGEKAITT